MDDHQNSSGTAVQALSRAGEMNAGGDHGEAAAGCTAILDCDSGFLLVLAKRLERAGWRHSVLDAGVSPQAVAALDVDGLIVDIEMLGDERLEWVEDLCRQRPDLSVIVCTAGSTLPERVRALRAGVDYWLTKPCHPEELVARMEAARQGRRVSSRKLSPSHIGEVVIRPAQYQGFVGELSLRLTRREYQLIELLDEARGEVLPRERIYELLWGYEMIRNDRSVDVLVHKLRRKLEQRSPGWCYIHTHFGVGYRLDPELLESAEVQPQPLAA